jgi:hypothetical protein
MCKKPQTFSIFGKNIDTYQLGALVQDAFPELKEGERELFISGVCNDCFDGMFEN